MILFLLLQIISINFLKLIVINNIDKQFNGLEIIVIHI